MILFPESGILKNSIFCRYNFELNRKNEYSLSTRVQTLKEGRAQDIG